MTRNVWIQHRDGVVQWRADASAVQRSVESYVRLLEQILESGQRNELLSYEGDPVQYIRTLVSRDQTLKLGLDEPRPAANMCWYDPRGDLTCGLVRDLGKLLGSLPGSEGTSRMFRAEGPPPVRVWGTALALDSDTWASEEVNLYVALSSDIWFPYVKGYSCPEFDEERYLDNTQLAARHTPRLNAFLRDVNALMKSVGSKIEVDEEESNYLDDYARWLSSDGIRLVGDKPNLIA